MSVHVFFKALVFCPLFSVMEPVFLSWITLWSSVFFGCSSSLYSDFLQFVCFFNSHGSEPDGCSFFKLLLVTLHRHTEVIPFVISAIIHLI
jgi:hypothetical protein